MMIEILTTVTIWRYKVLRRLSIVPLVCVLVVLATACASPDPEPQASQLTYYVQEGDTVESIADKYDISEPELRSANGLSSDESVAPKQSLLIPLSVNKPQATARPTAQPIQTISSLHAPTSEEPLPTLEQKFVLDSMDPPRSELEGVDSLLRESQFATAQSETGKLLESYPLSAELYYRLIKALTLETRLITSGDLPERANNIIYWDDHLGLICELSEAYVGLFGSYSESYTVTISELHEHAQTSLESEGQPCKRQPTREFNANTLALRYQTFAVFHMSLGWWPEEKPTAFRFNE